MTQRIIIKFLRNRVFQAIVQRFLFHFILFLIFLKPVFPVTILAYFKRNCKTNAKKGKNARYNMHSMFQITPKGTINGQGGKYSM